MSVLQALAPGPFGGLERVVEELEIGTRLRGIHVELAAFLTRDAEEPAVVDAVRSRGGEVHVIRAGRRQYGLEMRAFARLVENLRPDVVHTHGYHADLVAGRVAIRRGLPVVTTMHGLTGGGLKNRLYEQLQLRAARKFNAVVAVSDSMVERLTSQGIPRISMIRNAWLGHGDWTNRATIRREWGIPDEVFHVGWVGRLSREKGADLFVQALRHLHGLPFVASVIGGGRELARIKRLGAELIESGRLRLRDVVPRAERLFKAFDLFVLSSRTEGTPMVLLDAMAAGVPIVATMVGGVPEVVSPEEASLVAPDRPATLAQAIHETWQARPAANRRAAAALDRVHTHFSKAAWCQAYEKLYQSVLLQS